MLLVTGTGRSGTHYTSELLKQMGYDVPHEAVGKDGAASWKHIVSGEFVYIGKNREAEIDSTGFTRILHQVRHPLKVIASMQTFSDSTWAYMAKFIELDAGLCPIRRSMQAWVRWNEFIEPKADWRFQIEELKDVFPEFCKHAGIPTVEMPKVPERAKDSRTKRYNPLTLADLAKKDARLALEVEALANRYNYKDLSSFQPTPRPEPTSWFRKIFPVT